MQHRANPIPETVETVPGYPTNLKIYHIPASQYWYAQATFGGRRVVRSLKTKHHPSAVTAAKAFYNELLVKQATQQPLTLSSTFKTVAESLFKEDQGRVDRGERAQSLVDDSKYLYEADLHKFFNKYHVKDINFTHITEYVSYLKTRGKKPVGSKTIKNHFILINKILKHAQQTRLHRQVAGIPNHHCQRQST